MQDAYITLEEAAAFEGITYKGLTSRISRNPQQFKTKTQPREGGGKDQVMISVASLSAKGRKAWKAAQKVDGRDVIIDKRTDAAPWYVGADLNHFIEGDGGKRKKAYYEAVELAARIQDFIDYDGPDRTAYAERYALGLGVSLPTLYRSSTTSSRRTPGRSSWNGRTGSAGTTSGLWPSAGSRRRRTPSPA